MLRGSESISTYTRSNIIVWMALAFQAGVINVGGFMACHRFVSHVTGFATFFGVEVSRSDWGPALGMLLVPVLFLIGVMISAQLIDIPLKKKTKPYYYVSFGVIFLLLILVWLGGDEGWFGVFGEPLATGRDYALLAVLCLICGMQNGTITSVSRSVIRTTHLTGITTDLGLGLVRVFHGQKVGEPQEEILANFVRLGIIFFFGLGSVIGAISFRDLQYRAFVLPVFISGSLFLTTLYFQVLKKRNER